jgi:hypothetical protein
LLAVGGRNMRARVICWAVGGSKCARWAHLLGCWRQQVCVLGSFVGLLEAASVIVRVIC